MVVGGRGSFEIIHLVELQLCPILITILILQSSSHIIKNILFAGFWNTTHVIMDFTISFYNRLKEGNSFHWNVTI